MFPDEPGPLHIEPHSPGLRDRIWHAVPTAAGTLLLIIPNQLGVDRCAHVLEGLVEQVAPGSGWR